MLTNTTFKFLRDLAANNDRKWFQANRAAYEAAREEFFQQLEELIVGISAFDPPIIELEPRDCMFRINRDTRFSPDKSPYKTNFGAFMTDRGKKVTRAGYYFHVEPGNCFIAGGLYMPSAKELKAVRAAIDDRASEFRKVIGRKAFKDAFGSELPGERLKTAPRDYPKDHPDIDLLRLKSFEIMQGAYDREVRSKAFTKEAVKTFRLMKDYVHWLNRALDLHPV